MIDCLFERWLECHHQASYIIANYFPLHLNRIVHTWRKVVGKWNYMHRIMHVVPFSPLYTHEDMFNCSINFVHMWSFFEWFYLRLRDIARGHAWFKNNFAKMLSACNYYAGVATTSNAVSFRSLWNKSALQESVYWYGHTLHGSRDIAGIQFKFLPQAF